VKKTSDSEVFFIYSSYSRSLFHNIQCKLAQGVDKLDKAKIKIILNPSLTSKKPHTSIQDQAIKANLLSTQEIKNPRISVSKDLSSSGLDLSEQALYPVMTYTPVSMSSESHHESIQSDYWSNWIPESTSYHQDQPVAYPKASIVSSSWIRLAAAVSSAVITGLLIGFGILQLFQHDEKLSNTSSVFQSQPLSTVNQKELTDHKVYTFIQHGVFSSFHSAKQAQTQLLQKNIQSYILNGDQYILFLGFASQRKDALLLSQLLSAQQLDVFLKPIEIPHPKPFTVADEQKELWASFFNQTEHFVELFQEFTIKYLDSSNTSDLLTKSVVQKEIEMYFATANALKMTANTEQKTHIASISQSLQQVYKLMQNYEGSSSSQILWEMQNKLMQAVFSQKQLLEQIS
jgi:stage II sporulation protein B